MDAPKVPRDRSQQVDAAEAAASLASAGEAGSTAAFFDFDHTLLHGDAGVIFGKTLMGWGYEQGRLIEDANERARHHAYVSWHIARTAGQALAFRALNGIGLMKRSKLIELSYSFLKGLPAADMSARMERVWNEKIQERLYPEMMDVIEGHRKAGHRIVIVTTGLRELVEHSKKALGKDIEVLGVEMLSGDDGVWLGKVEGPLYGVHKAEALLDFAKRHRIDLEHSYAYSDHYSDAAFLATVGEPVAVNPQLRLALLARRRGWKTMWVMPPTRNGSAPDK